MLRYSILMAALLAVYLLAVAARSRVAALLIRAGGPF